MATWSDRKAAMGGLNLQELEAVRTEWGGTWDSHAEDVHARNIYLMLSEADEKPKVGEKLDRLLGLPTDQEAAVARERAMVDAAKRSAVAAETSAGTAKFAVIAAVVSAIATLASAVFAGIAILSHAD